jgi:hypothetical protein
MLFPAWLMRAVQKTPRDHHVELFQSQVSSESAFQAQRGALIERLSEIHGWEEITRECGERGRGA